MAVSVSRKRLARYMASELERGADAKGLIQEVAAYLVEHKQAHGVDYIISELAAELEAEGIHGAATVTTARPLSVQQRTMVRDFVANKIKVKSVELNEQVNPDLIGGIVIETPNGRYDRSLRHGIDQLISVK